MAQQGAKRQSAVTKHALSGNSAPEVEASKPRFARGRFVPARRGGATLFAQTLKKKAFAHQPKTKKHLRKLAGVLFFAAISTARATPRLLTLFEE